MAITFTAEQAGRLARDESKAHVVRLRDGRAVALRVAGAEDAAAVQRFVRGLSEQSRRYRFFAPIRELSPGQIERLTRSHPPDELALVGEITAESGESRIVALAQYVVCDALDAEFAVVVDDAWQRQGLGMQLVSALAEQAARAGVTALSGLVLPDNWPMLAFLTRLDCELNSDSDPNLIRAVKHLDMRSEIAA